MAAGLNATMTLAEMNQQYGARIATIRNAFSQLQQLYVTHWSATGAADYVAAGGTTQDRDNLGSAILEMINLNAVRLGQGTVAADGTVTTGTAGHNFDTFPARVSGLSVS